MTSWGSGLQSFLQSTADDCCRKKLSGVAIGVIVDGRELTACSGWADADQKRPVSETTVFEVGSLSKLLTSLLLAVSVTRDEIDLDDPVDNALDANEVSLPGDGQSRITFRSLANHRSSLPRLPGDLLTDADPDNPYIHYDRQRLYACLSGMASVRSIGSHVAYSNFGVGLLGHVLGRLAGRDYHTALRERVLSPLRMTHTTTESSSGEPSELATSHRKQGKPVRHWDFTEVTAGAGAVRSSLADMMCFLRANVYPEQTTLETELRLMREPSSLPECERKPSRFVGLVGPFFVALALASHAMFQHGLSAWLSDDGPYGFAHFLVIEFTVLMVSAIGGWKWGSAALAVVIAMTWSWWGADSAWLTSLWGGGAMVAAGTIWRGAWREIVGQLQGKGRLAWMDTKVDEHSVLWHNGMVRGAASFLAIVEGLNAGVVVLTNTARSVDDAGLRILAEVISAAKKKSL